MEGAAAAAAAAVVVAAAAAAASAAAVVVVVAVVAVVLAGQGARPHSAAAQVVPNPVPRGPALVLRAGNQLPAPRLFATDRPVSWNWTLRVRATAQARMGKGKKNGIKAALFRLKQIASIRTHSLCDRKVRRPRHSHNNYTTGREQMFLHTDAQRKPENITP